MDAVLFTTILGDKNFFDFKKMQYKYGEQAVAELCQLLYHTHHSLSERLLLRDFQKKNIVYLPNLARVKSKSARRLMAAIHGKSPFGLKAMEEEIQATFSIENIASSRNSIRKILSGRAPTDDAEAQIYGMKRGLDLIADSSKPITEENLRTLYQTAINNSLAPEDRLPADQFYRHDSVYVVGRAIEHQGLSAEKLPVFMKGLFAFIGVQDSMDELQKAAAIHFYIAYLHPYFDGNGRTARLVHLWYLVQQGYPSALFVPFSKFINESKSAYYKAYSQIEENAKISGVLDITPFLAYFAEHVYNRLDTQNPEAIQTIQTFNAALQRGEITEKEKALWEFVLSAYGREEFSTKQLEKDFGDAAYATIRAFVLKLTDLGLLTCQKYGNRAKYRLSD